jgi:hypothetical protein
MFILLKRKRIFFRWLFIIYIYLIEMDNVYFIVNGYEDNKQK